MCTTSHISKWLLVIGGLNWGLIGLGVLIGGRDWDVLNMLLGSIPTLLAIVYVLVGLAALMKLFKGCRCHKCAGGNMEKSADGMETSM